MELDLKKVSLDAYDTGGELTLTQEETAETIVPDYCPDIARIIETDGKVYLHSRECSIPPTGRAASAPWNLPSPSPPRATAGPCRAAST